MRMQIFLKSAKGNFACSIYAHRYYGILAKHNRKTLVSLCRKLLNFVAVIRLPGYDGMNWKSLLKSLTGFDADRCYICGAGTMIFAGLITAPRPP